jgi:hypothetical protein
VELNFDDDRVLEAGCKLELLLGGSRQTVEVEYFRRQHGRFVLKLVGVDSIEHAEKIIGAEMQAVAITLDPSASFDPNVATGETGFTIALGTSNVTVSGGGTGRDCKDISNVVFYTDCGGIPG